MSTTVAIDEAQAKLKDLIATLGPRDEVVITDNNRPVARLVAAALDGCAAAVTSEAAAKGQPQFGNCKGMLAIVAEDDEHLEDFQDYMS